MLGGFGWQELVIVLVIVMIIFGAGKLPEIAKSLGQSVREFRDLTNSPVIPDGIQLTSNSTVAEKAANGAIIGNREAIIDGVKAPRIVADSRDDV